MTCIDCECGIDFHSDCRCNCHKCDILDHDSFDDKDKLSIIKLKYGEIKYICSACIYSLYLDNGSAIFR